MTQKTLDTAIAKRKRGRPTGSITKDPAERLRAMASRRVPAAVRAINLVGNIAAYKPTEPQRRAIVTAIKTAVSNMEARMQSATGRDQTFQLPE